MSTPETQVWPEAATLAREGTRPECQLTGTDGNIFALLGVVCRKLERSGLRPAAAELKGRMFAGEAHSYEGALELLQEYVDAS